MEAFAEAEAEGNASITVDGQFVDYPIAEKARRTLVARSERAWRAEEEVVDDITAIVVYFHKH